MCNQWIDVWVRNHLFTPNLAYSCMCFPDMIHFPTNQPINNTVYPIYIHGPCILIGFIGDKHLFGEILSKGKQRTENLRIFSLKLMRYRPGLEAELCSVTFSSHSLLVVGDPGIGSLDDRSLFSGTLEMEFLSGNHPENPKIAWFQVSEWF